MAEFLHEVVNKREQSSRELPPAIEDWIRRYQDYYHRDWVLRTQLVDRIFGNLEEGTDDANL
jgi:hypothetical protein